MMIRATKKALNLSGKKSVKNEIDKTDSFPGEWYVDVVSLGKPGKMGLQFLHSPTMISVIVPGRSISKVESIFKTRVENFLDRHNYGKLKSLFELDSELKIYSTNSRSLLAHMKNIKMDTAYHCAKAETFESINYSWIEDIFLKYPFSSIRTGPKLITSRELLDGYIENTSQG